METATGFQPNGDPTSAVRLQEAKKTRQNMDEWVPVQKVAPQIEGFPELKNMFQTILASGGHEIRNEGGMQFVKRGSLDYLRQTVGSNPELSLRSIGALKKGYQNQISALQQNASASNGKDAGDIHTKISQLQDAYAGILNTEEGLVKALAQKHPATKRSLVDNWF